MLITPSFTSEDQIERQVEKAIDRLDRQFMSDNNTMTQEQYNAKVKEIDDWATEQFCSMMDNGAY